MTDTSDGAIELTNVYDSPREMAAFLNANNDNTKHSPAMRAALAQVRANLEIRRAVEYRNDALNPDIENLREDNSAPQY